MDQTELRAAATKRFNHGCEELIRAFGLTESPVDPWTFPAPAQRRARQLLVDIIVLFRESEVLSVAPYGKSAANDEHFQRFMRAARNQGGA